MRLTTNLDIEKTAKENQQLREAIKRSAVELGLKNRKLEIEAALERVRATAMSMDNSQGITSTVNVVFKELGKLGLKTIRCGIGIFDDQSNKVNVWTSSSNDSKNIANLSGDEYLEGHPLLEQIYDHWQLQKDFAYTLKGDDLLKYYKTTSKSNFPVGAPEKTKKVATQYYYCAMFPAGGLFAFRQTKFSTELKLLMKRFSEVFHLSFIRHQDLKKAEVQAREAQIETALERVRSRTMAMQHSDELEEASHLLDNEIRKLGIKTWGCAFHIHGEKRESDGKIWDKEWFSSEEGVLAPYKTPREKLFKKYYAIGKAGEILHIERIGSDRIANHYKYLQTLPVLGEVLKEAFNSGVPIPESQLDHVAYFNQGHLLFITYEEVPEAHSIFKRFAKVFEQTYTRFLDLQKAEAQAREFQIESALERVRSRTLGMQSSNEMAETAVVVFKQLIDLGIEPNRLFIGIVKEEKEIIEMWATDEDGSKIANKVDFDITKNKSTAKIYKAWKQDKKSLRLVMEGEEFFNYLKYINEELGISVEKGRLQKKRFQTLGFFSKGFIGLAAPEEQPEETTKLLERFAAVFNLTYTRFNDLKISEAHAIQAKEDLIKLKTEKKKAEAALTELKSAQSQLIQAEKMASLGELTAGIAHEIQNPLNFVNNFSEVSNELLDEIQEEIEIGNYEEVKEILKDIKQNLEKINLHGKRADSIVKGMLQHSRINKGEKEPIDINKLADEYLRLAYHGLRAKNKSFNANLETDYDDSIGKVSVIPQDIGRVVLNLITNAFYAVSEKEKEDTGLDESLQPFEPTVSVSTKKMNGEMEISVKDNGNGIPKNILDKIFQPFFTTKSAGQGTGLGLSMSYDIVKAHGGKLKVETQEGIGTSFIIHIPINNE